MDTDAFVPSRLPGWGGPFPDPAQPGNQESPSLSPSHLPFSFKPHHSPPELPDCPSPQFSHAPRIPVPLTPDPLSMQSASSSEVTHLYQIVSNSHFLLLFQSNTMMFLLIPSPVGTCRSHWTHSRLFGLKNFYSPFRTQIKCPPLSVLSCPIWEHL